MMCGIFSGIVTHPMSRMSAAEVRLLYMLNTLNANIRIKSSKIPKAAV